MSSGGSPNSTTNNDPPAWAVPYYQQGLQLAQQAATKPYESYNGQQVAGMTPDQIAAMNMTRQQAQGGMIPGAQGFAQSMLGGQGQYQGQANPYAGPNPYLENMIGAAQEDVTKAYTESTVPNMLAQFNSGGAFGGTAMANSLSDSQQNLAGELGDLSNSMRFQDYTTQQQLAEAAASRDQQAWGDFQGRQMQALGLSPQLDQAGYYGSQQLYGMGQQQQLNNQGQLDALYQNFLGGQNWDMDRLSGLAQMLGTIQGGSTTGPNPNYRSAGQNAMTAAAIAAAIWSDKDAKTDKQPMDPDKALEAVRSMPIETWRYHGDTEQHAGTYAQDFYNALGMPPKEAINSIDMFGALGGAVKALDKKLNNRKAA